MTRSGRPLLVVIGTSLAGLTALPVILRALPRDFRSPVVIVQHRAILSDDAGLVSALQRGCLLEVREVEDKDPLTAGRVYLAPADYHLLVEDEHLTLSTEARVMHARPSIDVLFESAADVFRERLAGMLLTGGNEDGAAGLQTIRSMGGRAYVQRPDEAQAWMMPQAALDRGPVDAVLSLDQLAALIGTLAVQP